MAIGQDSEAGSGLGKQSFFMLNCSRENDFNFPASFTDALARACLGKGRERIAHLSRPQAREHLAVEVEKRRGCQ